MKQGSPLDKFKLHYEEVPLKIPKFFKAKRGSEWVATLLRRWFPL